MMPQRFQAICKAVPSATVLAPSEVQSVLRRIPNVQEALFGDESSTCSRGQDVDLSAYTYDEIRAELRAFLPPSDELVLAILMAEHIGLTLRWRDLLDHIYALWRPSQDDLIVFSQSGKCAFTISHEEVLRKFALR